MKSLSLSLHTATEKEFPKAYLGRKTYDIQGVEKQSWQLEGFTCQRKQKIRVRTRDVLSLRSNTTMIEAKISFSCVSKVGFTI